MDKREKTILFSSAGRRVSLIKCFQASAYKMGLRLKVVAVDINPNWSPASQVADIFFKVPPCSDIGFFNSILKICKANSVDIIIPTIDTELLFYAENREKFLCEGISVLVGQKEFINFAHDKKLTIEHLNKIRVPTPKSWEIDENIEYPAILKHRFGSNSKGIRRIDSFKEIESLDRDRYIVQEICEGREFTINAFFDETCVSCVPHYRKFVRDGEVCFAETIYIEEFKKIADKIASSFKNLYTPLCFQGFVDEENSIKIFEVNARFCGGYPLCDKAGGKFAKWILEKNLGNTPSYNLDFEKNLRMLRYDDAIFLK